MRVLYCNCSTTSTVKITTLSFKNSEQKFKIFLSKKPQFDGTYVLYILCRDCFFKTKKIYFPVCKATIDEMLLAIAKVDPKRRADVGGYRMDSEGKSVTRTVQYSKSETYLTELMENICM